METRRSSLTEQISFDRGGARPRTRSAGDHSPRGLSRRGEPEAVAIARLDQPALQRTAVGVGTRPRLLCTSSGTVAGDLPPSGQLWSTPGVRIGRISGPGTTSRLPGPTESPTSPVTAYDS